MGREIGRIPGEMPLLEAAADRLAAAAAAASAMLGKLLGLPDDGVRDAGDAVA